MARQPEIPLGELRVVPLDGIRPHPLNDNKQSAFMFGKLLATIRSEGFAQPLVVRSGDGRGRFADGLVEILGGEQRWRAAGKLKMAQVPVYDLGNVPDLRANKLIINLNKLHGDSDEDALARLVREINAEGGEAALESLPLDEDTLKDLLDGDGLVDPDAAAGGGVGPEEDAGVTVELGAGVTARDLLVLLDVRGLSSADLTTLLDVARQWAFGRPDQQVPAWRDLVELLRRNTTPPR